MIKKEKSPLASVGVNGRKFRTYQRKHLLAGSSLNKNIELESRSIDQVVCWFILVVAYIFIALEEADFSILSASKENDLSKRIQNDNWSLDKLMTKLVSD